MQITTLWKDPGFNPKHETVEFQTTKTDYQDIWIEALETKPKGGFTLASIKYEDGETRFLEMDIGSKWLGEQSDTVDALLQVLSEYVLDRTFESYGNFVTKDPKSWVDGRSLYPYPNVHRFFGNFLGLSCGFTISTNIREVYNPLIKAIRENQGRSDYKEQRPYRSEWTKDGMKHTALVED